jgi:hypothetical protein
MRLTTLPRLLLRAVTLIALATAVQVAIAHADHAVTLEFKDLSADPPTTGEGQLLLGGDRLKMEVTDPSAGDDGSRMTMIFRGDLDATIFVDHERRAYSVLDQETMAAVSTQLEQAMKEMEAQLEQLPEEQREMMRKMMEGRMPQAAADPPVFEVRQTDRRDTIDGHDCVCYEVDMDGERVNEVWVTDWSSVSIGKEDFEVFKQMTEFYKQMLASMPNAGASMRQNFLGGMEKIDGFPVLMREYDGDTVSGETRFHSIEEIADDAAAYEPPAGYKEQKITGRG